MVERKAPLPIAAPHWLATGVFNFARTDRTSPQATNLLKGALAFILLICSATIAFAQSATGRPEKAKPPVKAPTNKRLPQTIPNKTTTQNPEENPTQQTTETKPPVPLN